MPAVVRKKKAAHCLEGGKNVLFLFLFNFNKDNVSNSDSKKEIKALSKKKKSHLQKGKQANMNIYR